MEPRQNDAASADSHETSAHCFPPPAPAVSTQAPASGASKMEHDMDSHIPYVIPLPSTTPSAGGHHYSGLPVISTLPPIVTARPLGDPNHHHHSNNNYIGHRGNIPVVNGVRQTGAPPPFATANSNYPPTVVNLSTAPSAAAPHMLPPDLNMLAPSPPFFEYMDQCRYTAGFMLCYYMSTFFFLQPLFVGVLGVLTGFLGYYGSRAPIYAAHIKWVRGYLWMNCAMVVMNVWYFAITMLFLMAVRASNDGARDASSNSNSDSNATATAAYRFDEQHLGIFIGVIVALNVMLHVRGVGTAKRFHAEMLRAGPLPGIRTVIVLANPV